MTTLYQNKERRERVRAVLPKLSTEIGDACVRVNEALRLPPYPSEPEIPLGTGLHEAINTVRVSLIIHGTRFLTPTGFCILEEDVVDAACAACPPECREAVTAAIRRAFDGDAADDAGES